MKYSIYFFLLLSLAACVPSHTSYYQPTAEIGSAINDQCGTAIAPKSTYKLTLDGIDVRIKGYDNYLAISLRIPKERIVDIGNNFISVVNGSKSFQAQPLFKYYDRELKKSISTGNVLQGANEKFILGNIEPRIFSSVVKFADSPENSYQVKLSPIIVNGKTKNLPVINFKKVSGFGVYPINC